MNEEGDGIAIVGIGCNFPGGEGLDNFWKVLNEGKNCTVEIPPERFNIKDWYDPDDDKKGKIRTTRAALIDGFNEFDNRLFGITDMEAERMDPQQKLLLECTYRALENAGVPIEKISGSDTGVFIGLMNRDFEMLVNENPNNIDHFNGTGTAMSIAANRISYWLNVAGPSLTLDTACSSSLVALHFACQAIKQGDCEMALCGGVSLIMDPRIYVALSKAKMISPDGTSKPFCKNADGYGRGEGCGILLLKPLRKAVQDFNKIWGVISLSAVNQDGRSVTPITRPSQKQQEKLLHKVYASHIDPSVVQYVEAHGTGTPIGDPTEAASIGNIIGKARFPGSPALKMGSVKSNIGHTESAAGMAGLIKVLLMMHHEKIVPSLHYSEDNSSINTKELNLCIPTSVQTWKESQNTGRIAGVNSFGFGGTNAHVVIKQFKQTQVSPHLKRPVEIFVFSAASSESLKLTIVDTAEKINKMDSVSMLDLAYTSACRRGHTNNKHRSAFVTSSLKELEQQLTRAVNTETVQVKSKPDIVFVFCGNGVNYKGMCKTLLKFEPVFRAKFKEIEDILYSHTSINLIELIENDFEDFSIIKIAQPLLFATQVALVCLLKHWGIQPVALVGHSVGEVAAAHCSGLLSLKDAVKVIYQRSTLQSKVTGGKMLVVSNVPVAKLSKSIETYSERVSIAAFNSPLSCTLSGEAEAIENIEKQLAIQFKELNIFLFNLDVPAAYHSHMMDPILHSVEESLQDITRQQPVIELVSTVSGKVASEDDFTTGHYWARNVREPVAFEQAIQSVSKGKENVVFVEIGPKRALERNIKDSLEKETLVYPSIQPNKDYETIFMLAEKLFVQGYNPNWCNVFDGYNTIPTLYPKYQFDHAKKTKGFEVVVQGGQRTMALSHPLLHSVINNMEFICSVSEASTPYIYEHKNNDTVLIPGSFYVELGIASLMNSSLPKLCLGTHQIGVKFTSPCIVKQSPHEIKIQLKLDNNVTHFKVISSNAVYATGEITQNPDTTVEKGSIALQLIIQRCTTVIRSDEMYENLKSVGFQYGQIYRQLSNIRYGEYLNEAVARITVHKQIRDELREYYIHPVVLDAFLQMSVIMSTARTEAKAGFPSSIGSIQLQRPLQEEMVIYMKVIKDAKDYIEICGCFSDKNGTVLVELKHVKITFLGTTSSQPNVFLYEHEWEDVSTTMIMQTPAGTPKSLIFADNFEVAQNLSPYLHKDSTYIMYNEWKTEMESGNTLIYLFDKMKVILSNYDEFLFMWGINKFKAELPSNYVQHIAMCSEAYRQVILALKSRKAKVSIRTITFRTMETAIDHINPGFGLLGMTRSCVMEIPEMSFQQIDVSSCNSEDIAALAKVIVCSTAENNPEILIKDGSIYASEIVQTRFQDKGNTHPLAAMDHSKMCTLYSIDPYTVTELSAEVTKKRAPPDHSNHNIEVQVTKICAHSQDYFPVTDSSYKYGDTLYWKSESKAKHSLLALDFTGTITAIGKDIKKLKIGEQIVSCYPVTASSIVTLPRDVCYRTKKVPFLKHVPCVSFFLLAWVILHKTLQRVRGQPRLAIIASEPKSIFCEVLAVSANEAGWKAVKETPTSAAVQRVRNCDAVVLLSSPDGMLANELTHFPFLKDIVILGDNEQIKRLQPQIGESKEHVTVHTLNIENLFQKTILKQSSKPFYVWLKSIQTKHLLNLQYSVFQHDREANGTGSLPSSFNCTAIPLIVLKDDKLPRSLSDIPVFYRDENIFKCNAIYVVSGGLTGLGFETVKFIAQHGGSHIVILSRRKPTTAMATEIKALQSQCVGTIITSLQCNVVISSDVERSVTWIRRHFPKIPIKGVFHSAAVFHDGILENLSLTHFENVLGPKVAGAVNLHCATKREELDYFICYSSIASFIGNPGQSNYAAANSFLDNFCHYRRNMGLSGQSINWGALNLGVLQNQDMLQDILKSKGILTMDIEEIHEMLRKILILNNPQQAVMKLNFSTLNRTVFSFTPSLRTRFTRIMTEELSKLEEISTDNKVANSLPLNPKDYISSLVSDLSHINQSDIAMNMSLTSLGIDSMLAMTLQNHIFHERNLKLPLLKLLDPETTIDSLSSILEENEIQAYRGSEVSGKITILEETRL